MTTVRQRFLDVINFKKPEDRLPMVEWSAWWDKTTDNWKKDGYPELDYTGSMEYFGLDSLHMMRANVISEDAPKPAYHGAGIMKNEDDYEKLKPYLFRDEEIEGMVKAAKELKPRHENGEIIVRQWLDGYFWCPRELFGIENHLFSFYDYPDLYHTICKDLLAFSKKILEAMDGVLKLDLVCIAEDMSYNHGPMLSYDTFKEFMYPYYKEIVAEIKKRNLKVIVDTDGKVEAMIPWLLESGIDGLMPLERQAMVDLNEIRKEYPDFIMLGGFDKRVIHLGREAVKAEFERILPTMKSLGFIPSVDHNTPPDVSLEDYKVYMELFKEYTEKAVKE